MNVEAIPQQVVKSITQFYTFLQIGKTMMPQELVLFLFIFFRSQVVKLICSDIVICPLFPSFHHVVSLDSFCFEFRFAK